MIWTRRASMRSSGWRFTLERCGCPNESLDRSDSLLQGGAPTTNPTEPAARATSGSARTPRIEGASQPLATMGICPIPRGVGQVRHVTTAAPAALEAREETMPATNSRVVANGKFLRAGDERFLIKGVTYGTFAPDAAGYQFPPLPQIAEDF